MVRTLSFCLSLLTEMRPPAVKIVRFGHRSGRHFDSRYQKWKYRDQVDIYACHFRPLPLLWSMPLFGLVCIVIRVNRT